MNDLIDFITIALNSSITVLVNIMYHWYYFGKDWKILPAIKCQILRAQMIQKTVSCHLTSITALSHLLTGRLRQLILKVEPPPGNWKRKSFRAHRTWAINWRDYMRKKNTRVNTWDMFSRSCCKWRFFVSVSSSIAWNV